LPGRLVRAGARWGDRLGLTVPGAGDLSLTRLANLALGDNPYVSARLRTELGWAPSVPHEEGLARAARWLGEESMRLRAVGT
jgi:nucleoside-diphosphate-sugar epimerase